MKANEFIKKFGWAHTVWLLEDNDLDFIDVHSSIDGSYRVAVSELKRLIESHEIVFEHGSIERAELYANSSYTAPEVSERLFQAISDVESCQ